MNPLGLAASGHWNWSAAPVERIAEGIERQILSGDRLMICRLSFAPRVVTPVHSHPHEQMTLIERGRVRFHVSGADRVAAPGDVLLFPSGVEHGATILDEPAVLIDIFSPPREDFLPARDVETRRNGDGLFSLAGKVALVTGASRGLGESMAIGLAGAGADLILHASAPPAGTARAVEHLGRRVVALGADFADRRAPDRLAHDAVAAFGRIDILINNAGMIRRQPAAEHRDDWWDEVIEVNLSSVFRLSRAIGRHMLERGGGKIVNVASLLSFQGGTTVPGYAAAKGGVAQLTKALANEWAGRGINVNAIAPGYMVTDNTAALQADPTRARRILERIPAGRWGMPADVAGAAIFLASSASDYVNGHVLVVDGGWLGG
jgi:2-deoxy-D-gluconate 3-dehydrogenase